MKKILFVLFLLPALLSAQDERIFSGKCAIAQSGGGSGYWTVSITNFNDPGGLWDATEITVGDKVYFTDGGIPYSLDITTIVGTPIGATATVRVSNIGVTGISSVPTTSNAAVSRGSIIMGLAPWLANLSGNENQLFQEHTMYLIDSLGDKNIFNVRDTLTIADGGVKTDAAGTQSMYFGNFDDGNSYGSGDREGIFFDPSGNGIGTRGTFGQYYALTENYGSGIFGTIDERYGANKLARYGVVGTGSTLYSRLGTGTGSGATNKHYEITTQVDTLYGRGSASLGFKESTRQFYAGLGKADSPTNAIAWKSPASDTTLSYAVGLNRGGTNTDFRYLDIVLRDSTADAVTLYDNKLKFKNADPVPSPGDTTLYGMVNVGGVKSAINLPLAMIGGGDGNGIYGGSDTLSQNITHVKMGGDQQLGIGYFPLGFGNYNQYDNDAVGYFINTDVENFGLGKTWRGSKIKFIEETYGNNWGTYTQEYAGHTGRFDYSINMFNNGGTVHNGVISIGVSPDIIGGTYMESDTLNNFKIFYGDFKKQSSQTLFSAGLRRGSLTNSLFNGQDSAFMYSVTKNINGTKNDLLSIKFWEANPIEIYDKYRLPDATPSATNNIVSTMQWTGDGTTTVPSFKSSSYTMSDFTSDVANSGTGETTLYTYTTPANTLNATGDKLKATYGISLSDATATAQIRVKFAGTTIFDSGALTLSAVGMADVDVLIIRTGASTARAKVVLSTPTGTTMIYTTQTDLTGLTFTNTNVLALTGQAGGGTGGSNDITAKLGTIEKKAAAW